MTMRGIPVVTAIVLILVFGCADREAKIARSKIQLIEQVDQYHDSFFWHDYNRASLFVAPEMRSDFLDFSKDLRRGFTLEEFTIKEVQMSPTGERAAVVVERSCATAPSVTLQSQELTQEWVLRDGAWYLAGPPY